MGTVAAAPAPQVELETADAIAEADAILADADDAADGTAALTRMTVAFIVLGVWAIVVIAYSIWILADKPSFVCTVPGDPTVEGYTGTCESGWSAAWSQVRDVLATFILPVVTLVLGYYFGKSAAGEEDA